MSRHRAPDHKERIAEMEKEFKEGMDAIGVIENDTRQQVEKLVQMFTRKD